MNAGEVLAAVQRGGLGIVDVSTREADLEDVFLNLTRAGVAADPAEPSSASARSTSSSSARARPALPRR